MKTKMEVQNIPDHSVDVFKGTTTSSPSKCLDEGEGKLLKGSSADELVLLSGLNVNNTEDLMVLLSKNPDMQAQLLNLIKLLNMDGGLNKENIATSDNLGIISESTHIGECITPEDDGKLLNGISQTQMVMSPCILPENSPNYAMNTAPCSPPSSSSQMPLGMPAEYIPEVSALEQSTEESTKIMEESSNNAFEEVEKRSIDMTFGSAELKLSSIYPNITTSDGSFCSELHTFCDKMNSPDYEYSESTANCEDVDGYFENSAIRPTCSPNDLLEPPEYAVSPNDTMNSSDYTTFSDAPSNIHVNVCSPDNSASSEYTVLPNDQISSTACTFSDVPLENSIVQPFCSPNYLLVSPEYAISPKSSSPLNVVSHSSPEWDRDELSGVIGSSPSSSPSTICEDSDVENDIQSNLTLFSSDDMDFNPMSSQGNLMNCDISCVDTSSTYGMTVSTNILHYNHPKDPLPFATSFVSCPNLMLSVAEEVGDDNDHLVPFSSGESPLSVVSERYDMEDPQSNFNNSMEFDNSLDTYSVCADSPFSTGSGCIPSELHAVLPNATGISFVSEDSHAIEAKQMLCDDDNQGSTKKKRKMDTSSHMNGINVQSNLPETEFLDEKYPLEYKNNGVICRDYVDVNNHPVFKEDCDGDLPLHNSVAKEDTECTKQILHIMGGQKINSKNRKQQTPLHRACYINNILMICLLLQSGADPEITDTYGNNMMHIGCINSSIMILQVLASYYAKSPHKINDLLKAHNYEGLTPLHEATKKRDMSIINYLLQDLNCNLDMKEWKAGMTVLVYTLEKQDWVLAQLFIECGASLNEPTNAGMFPLDFVATSDNLELAKDLIKRNAESGVKNKFCNNEMKILFESELGKRRRKGKKRTRTPRSDWKCV